MKLNIKATDIDPDVLAEHIVSLEEYTDQLRKVIEESLENTPEASLVLPEHEATRNQVEEVSEKLLNSELKYIIHIGIGGSNLGSKSIYDALFGYVDNYTQNKKPRPLFLDTNNIAMTRAVLDFLKKETTTPEEVAVVIVSKSGGTTETVVHAELVLQILKETIGEGVYSRVAVISNEDSPLFVHAQKHGMHILSIPKHVGGRFSVFSSAGLLTLRLLDVDIDMLLEGAKAMRDRCISPEVAHNYAQQSAVVLYEHARKGRRVHTNFFFDPRLESLGKWYRQLLAESIGKRENKNGNVVFSGITPEVSIGSTDLHSMAQLYLGGPKDKITSFITVEQDGFDITVPEERVFAGVVDMVSGKTVHQVNNAIYEGTKKAYQKNDLPFMEITLEEITLFELGAFMQYKMMEIMYLGCLMNIDAFNQPSVEDYKIETKKYLES